MQHLEVSGAVRYIYIYIYIYVIRRLKVKVYSSQQFFKLKLDMHVSLLSWVLHFPSLYSSLVWFDLVWSGWAKSRRRVNLSLCSETLYFQFLVSQNGTFFLPEIGTEDQRLGVNKSCKSAWSASIFLWYNVFGITAKSVCLSNWA